MKQNDKDPFVVRVKGILDEKSESLDADTQRRLSQARMKAIARLGVTQGTQQRPLWFSWVPAGAMAAGLLAVGIYQNQAQLPLPAIYQDPLQQLAAENMELLENLEFAAWLVLKEGS